MNPFCKPAYRISKYILIAGLAAACLFSPAWAASGTIHSIGLDASTHRLSVDASGPVRAVVNTVTMNNRRRVIIDIQDAAIGYDLPKDAELLSRLAAAWPAVKNISINQFGTGGQTTVRILLDVDGDLAAPQLVQGNGSHLVLQLGTPPSLTANNNVSATPRPALRSVPAVDAPQQRSSQDMVQLMDEQRRMIVGLQQQMASLAKNQNDEIQRLRDTNANLQNRLAAAQPMDSAHAQAELNNLKQSVVKLGEQVKSLNLENQNLKTRLAVAPQNTTPALKPSVAVTTPAKPTVTLSGTTAPKPVAIAPDAKTQQDLAARQAEIERLRNMNQSLQDQLALTLKAKPTPPSPAPVVSSVEMENMKKTLVSMNQKYDALSQENQDLKKRLSVQPAVDPRVQNELAELRAENTRLKVQPVELQHDANVEMTAQLNRFKERVDDLQGQLASAQMENNRLKAEAVQPAKPSNNSELGALQTQLQGAQESLNTSIKTINDQNKEIAYLRNQVADLKRGYDQSAKDQIASLKNDLDNRDAQIKQLQDQFGTRPEVPGQAEALKKQLDKLTGQYKSTVDDLTRERENLQKQLTESKTRLQEARTRQDQLSSELNRMQAEQSKQGGSKDQAVVAMQKQMDADKAELVSLRANVTELQKENEKLAVAASQSKPDMSLFVARADLDEAKKESLALKTTMLKMNEEIEKLQKHPPAAPKTDMSKYVAKSEVEKTLAENKKLSSDLDKTVAELQRFSAENQTLKDNLQKAQSAAPGATAPDSKQGEQMIMLQNQLTEMKTRHDEAVKDVAEGRQQVAKLEQDLKDAKLKASAKVAKGDKSGTGTQLQAQVDELSKQLEAALQDKQNLQNQVAELSKANSEKGGGTPTASFAMAEKHFSDARALVGSGNAKKAIEEYKQALQLDPNNSEYVYQYTIALADDKQYDMAINVLLKHLQRNPGDRLAYHQLGKVYLLNDQVDAANQALSRALPVSTLNNYATSLKKLNRLSEAEDVYKLALTLSPNDTEVLFNLGTLYNAANKLDQAKSTYQEALRLKPDFAEAHYNLGLIYSKMGDKTQAIDHLEKFLKLSPNARNADTIRNYVAKLKA